MKNLTVAAPSARCALSDIPAPHERIVVADGRTGAASRRIAPRFGAPERVHGQAGIHRITAQEMDASPILYTRAVSSRPIP